MDNKVPISVAIITKNEEKNLPNCLRSVSFAGDIVIVDSGSTDRTIEIAREFGCRVFIEEWKGYNIQKTSAIEKSLYEWVLLIDADERIPDDTKVKIIEAIRNPVVAAYSLSRKNYLHGRWLKHSDYWPDRQIRLFNKNKGMLHGNIHEQWITEGEIKNLNAHIDHYGFSTYSDMLKTLNDYSTIAAGELFSLGRRANLLSPLYHGVGMFLKIYILKKGFLDGFDGLVTALTKAGGSFFKYAKLIEMQRYK